MGYPVKRIAIRGIAALERPQGRSEKNMNVRLMVEELESRCTPSSLDVALPGVSPADLAAMKAATTYASGAVGIAALQATDNAYTIAHLPAYTPEGLAIIQNFGNAFVHAWAQAIAVGGIATFNGPVATVPSAPIQPPEVVTVPPVDPGIIQALLLSAPKQQN